MSGDENGGTFGGDGSVRWEIRSGDEVHGRTKADGALTVMRRSGRSGTHCAGVDCDHDRDFVLTIKVPKGKTPEAFLQSFKIGRDDTGGAVVSVRVPIKPVPEQIQVRWRKSAASRPRAASGRTGASSRRARPA